ncbi:hypothetical protein KSP39_PZI003620 [Platanthera zijinensis]|uniref:Uncharacterized protein n=1 Tax=Platanthera zijinensis TaxID=2320716 RepID=A0AAP0BUJ9_9ASPA
MEISAERRLRRASAASESSKWSGGRGSPSFPVTSQLAKNLKPNLPLPFLPTSLQPLLLTSLHPLLPTSLQAFVPTSLLPLRTPSSALLPAAPPPDSSPRSEIATSQLFLLAQKRRRPWLHTPDSSPRSEAARDDGRVQCANILWFGAGKTGAFIVLQFWKLESLIERLRVHFNVDGISNPLLNPRRLYHMYKSAHSPKLPCEISDQIESHVELFLRKAKAIKHRSSGHDRMNRTLIMI